MEEIVSKKLYISDDVEMQFHAVMSDADAQGNDIVKTYARKDAVKALEAQGKRQNEALTKVEDKTTSVQHQANNTSAEVKGVSAAQHDDEEAIVKLQGELSQAMQRIQELEGKAKQVSTNKGAFATENALIQGVTPKVGDFAVVIAPKQDVEPATYWGNKYLGIKAENIETWHNSAREVRGCIYTGDDGILYMVVMNVTLGTLVESHHINDTELVEDGIIEPVAFGGAYIYICEVAGIWKNTYTAISGIDVMPNTTSQNVYDGELTQENINLSERVNSIVGNSNIMDISNKVNVLVDVVNEIQRKVALVDNMDYVHLQKLALTCYTVTGDLHKNLLGISPMPIVLTEN